MLYSVILQVINHLNIRLFHGFFVYFLYKSNINPYGSCEISNLDYIEV